jgi:hypothetical protein
VSSPTPEGGPGQDARPGQDASAAGFAGPPYDFESDKESKAEDLLGAAVDAANRAAVRTLADNMFIRGTTAFRLAGATSDWASDGRLETRSTKVPTRSGCGVTIETANDDILSGGVLPIMSVNVFASKERGHKPDDDDAAGAGAFGTRRVAPSAGGRPAASTRRLADGVFARALSGNTNPVAASARQPDSYARRHESIEAAGVAFGERKGAAVAWDGPATSTKRPVVDSLTRAANQKTPALICPDGSMTHSERKAAA